MSFAPPSASGRFCWFDLAATDAATARRFYTTLFGWQAFDQAANGGTVTRLALDGRGIGSLYPLRRRHVEQGVASHWTPYVRVDDVEATAARAMALGGEVLIRPFEVSGIARIGLIADAVGARIGLWEPTASHGAASAHG